MVQDTPIRDQDKFMLRLPDGLRERVAEAGKSNNRSMNSEIVTILENALLSGTGSAFEHSAPGPNALASLIEAHTGQLQITNAKLDQLIALLTPKDATDNLLSDLLGHLVMLGREQLTLAHRTIDALDEISQQLPPPTATTPKSAASNGDLPV